VVGCKFQDVSTETDTPSYFSELVGEAYPFLGDYWERVSYNQIKLTGSTGADGWYTMPGNRSVYYDSSGTAETGKLYTDCATGGTTSTDPNNRITAGGVQVDVSSYYGVIMLFNTGIDNCSPPPMVGPCQNYGQQLDANHAAAWITPGIDSAHSQHEVGHEMGHGFALPHSHASAWDIMSYGNHATYVGDITDIDVHTIADNKMRLAQSFNSSIMPSELVYDTSSRPDCSSVTIDYLGGSQPQPGTCHFLMAKIPLPNGDYYTVESRHRTADGYEASAPTDGVVVHYVFAQSPNPDNGDEFAFVCQAGADLPSKLCPQAFPAAGQPGYSFSLAPGGSAAFSDMLNHVSITAVQDTGTGYVVSIPPPPTVTSIDPMHGQDVGPGGAQPYQVHIYGAHFTGATAVYFGEFQAMDNNGDIGPGQGFTVDSDSEITAWNPGSDGGDPAHLQVITASGYSTISSADVFTFDDPPLTLQPGLTITSITPSSGSVAGGQTVTVKGSGFMPQGGSYTFSGFTMLDLFGFGGVRGGSVQVIDDSTATFVTGAVTYGQTVHVAAVARTASGTAYSQPTSGDLYTFTGPSRPDTPTITSVQPNVGPADGGSSTNIVITGTNLATAGDVQFGDLNSAYDFDPHAGQITVGSADVPPAPWGYPGPPTPADVVVVTDAVYTSPLALADQYIYTSSGSSLDLPDARDYAGMLDARNGSVTSSRAAPPVITALSSNVAGIAGGERLVIQGSGFTGATGVRFGRLKTTQFTVDSDRQLTVVVPPDRPGSVQISIVTPHGRSAAHRNTRFGYHF